MAKQGMKAGNVGGIPMGWRMMLYGSRFTSVHESVELRKKAISDLGNVLALLGSGAPLVNVMRGDQQVKCNDTCADQLGSWHI